MGDWYWVCSGLESKRRFGVGYLENCGVYGGLVP